MLIARAVFGSLSRLIWFSGLIWFFQIDLIHDQTFFLASAIKFHWRANAGQPQRRTNKWRKCLHVHSVSPNHTATAKCFALQQTTVIYFSWICRRTCYSLSWPSWLLPFPLVLPDALFFPPPSSGSQQCATLSWSKDARLHPEMYIILPSLRPDPGVNSPHSSEEAAETERSQMSKLWWMKSDDFGFFSHYFSARLLVFNAPNLHLVVLSSQGFFFPFRDVHMYVALIIAS